MSEACRHCYAQSGRYLFPAVIERLAWNYSQAQRGDFAEKMIREARRKGCLAVRVHASGDVFSADYASAWSEVFAACPNVRFWSYSRSWASLEIWPSLRAWAGFKNVRLWLSCDAFIGLPPDVPQGARVAWLMTRADEDVPKVDLVFRIRRLRALPTSIGLRVLPVCPNEVTTGKESRNAEVTCGSCFRCLR